MKPYFHIKDVTLQLLFPFRSTRKVCTLTLFLFFRAKNAVLTLDFCIYYIFQTDDDVINIKSILSVAFELHGHISSFIGTLQKDDRTSFS